MGTWGRDLASFQGLLHLQCLLTRSMQKQREKAWGILSRDLWPDRQMLSHLLLAAKWYTRLILHSVLATEMGQVPVRELHRVYETYLGWSHYSKRLLRQAWKYPAVTQSSRGVKRQHYLELHCLYHSYPTAVKLRTRQVGLTSPLEHVLIL